MRDCWATKPNSYVRNVFTGKPPATVCSSARRAIRLCVQGKSGTHLWRMSQLTTCSVLRRDTLWICPELPYRSRAGQLVQQCSVARSGVLLSDLQTKLEQYKSKAADCAKAAQKAPAYASAQSMRSFPVTTASLRRNSAKL